ncbi:MAG: hypothetical protein KJ592_02900 [Nanoarchaeota archaeon]|nr:hypothetical protein [Nanoarchaeota archaeon]
MDDKELIKKARNSFNAKKSKAEILEGFQKRGYKLAYAEKIIAKAKRPKRIAIVILITAILFFSLTFSAYTVFSTNEKVQIKNPLSGFKLFSAGETQNTDGELTNINLEDIEITPEYISFILNELEAWQLHKNPLTLEDPIINFKIEEKTFYSEIKNEIKTYEGLSENADIQFETTKKDLVEAIISNNSKEIFKQSLASGNTQVEIKANEIELASKGYLKLYETLQS